MNFNWALFLDFHSVCAGSPGLVVFWVTYAIDFLNLCPKTKENWIPILNLEMVVFVFHNCWLDEQNRSKKTHMKLKVPTSVQLRCKQECTTTQKRSKDSPQKFRLRGRGTRWEEVGRTSNKRKDNTHTRLFCLWCRCTDSREVALPNAHNVTNETRISFEETPPIIIRPQRLSINYT